MSDESPGPDLGPPAQAAEQATEHDAVASDEDLVGGLSVLIVEDDPSHQLLIRRALSKEGSHFTMVQLAETSSEALGYATQMSFDCWLVDNRIPGHRGLDLVDHLRDRGVDAPFVLMTSAGSEDLAVQAYRKHVADYVVKEPGFWDDLEALLVRVVIEARGQKKAAKLTERLRRTSDKLQQLNADLQIQNQELASVKAALAERDAEVVRLRAQIAELEAK